MSNYENSTTKKESKTLNDKPFWAVYLNMARHNAYLKLAHINAQLGESKLDKEEDIEKSACLTLLEGNDKPEKAEKVLKHLGKHFPFLRYYTVLEDNADKKDKSNEIFERYERQLVHKIITSALTFLEDLRNEHTHNDGLRENTIDWETRKRIFYRLENIFEAAVRKIKVAPFQDEHVKHLRKFDGAEGFGRNRKAKPNPNFFYAFLNKEKEEFTVPGLAFFICLFLEKGEAQIFLQNLYGFKGSDTLDKKATKEAFSAFCTRLPQLRSNAVVEDKTSAALYMLDELQRCPKELYDVLLPETQKVFFTTNETDDNETEIEEEDKRQDNRLLRHSNRFAYFAMRYIDQNECFQSFRFQIDMGVFYHSINTEKIAIDHDKRYRRIGKSIKVFQRLQDTEEQRQKKWEEWIVTNPPENYDKPFMSDTKPHYHFPEKQHQIGIKMQETTLPELHAGESPENVQPDFWLSEYELPVLVFWYYLADKLTKKYEKEGITDISLITKENPEQVLKDYKGTLHRFYKDLHQHKISGKYTDDEALTEMLLKRYKFDIKDIPTEIIQYIQGTNDNKNIEKKFQQYAENKITKLLENTVRKIDRFDGQVKDVKLKSAIKMGKKGWDDMKTGKLADFLAKDMLWLQPSLPNEEGIKGRDKLTGYNFQVLQASLAQYNGNTPKHIKDLFKMSGLIENPRNAHPFLDKISPRDYATMGSFYKAYLKERKFYLEKCLREKQYQTYPFLKADTPKWKDRWSKYEGERLTKEVLSQAVNVPRALLLDKFKEWVKKHAKETFTADNKKKTAALFDTTEMQDLVLSDSRMNTLFLIQKYMEYERKGDKQQPFYEYPRTYKRLNELMDSPKEAIPFITSSPHFAQVLKETKAKLPEREAFLNEEIKKLSKKLRYVSPRSWEERQVKKELAEKKAALENLPNHIKHFSDINRNEQSIRLVRGQDMLTFLIAEQMLFTAGLQPKKDFQLKKIKPLSKPLSEQIPYQLHYRVNKMDDKGHRTKDFLYEITVEQEKLKIKNFGDFYRFTKDRRINHLFLWLQPNTVIQREHLEKELVSYYREAVKLYEKVHAFEKMVAKKWTTMLSGALHHEEAYLPYIGKSRFETILNVFYHHHSLFSAEKTTAKALRNAFGHNQYPRPEDISGVEANRTDVRGIAKEITEKGIALFQQYIDAMKG